MGPRRPLELSGGPPGAFSQRRSSRHDERVRHFDIKGPNGHVKFEKQKRSYFEIAFKIRNELLDADHKLVAASYLNLIDSIPDVDQALKYFEKILCIRLEEYGPLHPTVAKVYKRRGWFLVKNRKQPGRKVKRANAQTSDTKYSWVPIHVELSEKLREYKGRSSELVSIIKKMNGQGLRTIPLEDGSDGELLEEIDPFTFFANFNRPITEKNKARMWELVKSELNLNSISILLCHRE